jgi:hypothetical protein
MRLLLIDLTDTVQLVVKDQATRQHTAQISTYCRFVHVQEANPYPVSTSTFSRGKSKRWGFEPVKHIHYPLADDSVQVVKMTGNPQQGDEDSSEWEVEVKAAFSEKPRLVLVGTEDFDIFDDVSLLRDYLHEASRLLMMLLLIFATVYTLSHGYAISLQICEYLKQASTFLLLAHLEYTSSLEEDNNTSLLFDKDPLPVSHHVSASSFCYRLCAISYPGLLYLTLCPGCPLAQTLNSRPRWRWRCRCNLMETSMQRILLTPLQRPKTCSQLPSM